MVLIGIALIFNGMDLVTGILGAVHDGEKIQSNKLRDGLFKKVRTFKDLWIQNGCNMLYNVLELICQTASRMQRPDYLRFWEKSFHWMDIHVYMVLRIYGVHTIPD